ncbi:RING/FYVE/PHD-type [Hexamita inflata]|uniref:RING/FYVE/PHD-type n=1 Tax=Hexamita inflata TaxID=28002 RepID=A0AA86PJ12_9EUKA|nr:RING/FYVE/PHD-type [Hexamita inflata]
MTTQMVQRLLEKHQLPSGATKLIIQNLISRFNVLKADDPVIVEYVNYLSTQPSLDQYCFAPSYLQCAHCVLPNQKLQTCDSCHKQSSFSVVFQCLHSACVDCVSGLSQCPRCKKPIKLILAENGQNMKLKMKCPRSEQGCKQEFLLNQLQDHLKLCRFNSILEKLTVEQLQQQQLTLEEIAIISEIPVDQVQKTVQIILQSSKQVNIDADMHFSKSELSVAGMKRNFMKSSLKQPIQPKPSLQIEQSFSTTSNAFRRVPGTDQVQPDADLHFSKSETSNAGVRRMGKPTVIATHPAPIPMMQFDQSFSNANVKRNPEDSQIMDFNAESEYETIVSEQEHEPKQDNSETQLLKTQVQELQQQNATLLLQLKQFKQNDEQKIFLEQQLKLYQEQLEIQQKENSNLKLEVSTLQTQFKSKPIKQERSSSKLKQSETEKQLQTEQENAKQLQFEAEAEKEKRNEQTINNLQKENEALKLSLFRTQSPKTAVQTEIKSVHHNSSLTHRFESTNFEPVKKFEFMKSKSPNQSQALLAMNRAISPSRKGRISGDQFFGTNVEAKLEEIRARKALFMSNQQHSQFASSQPTIQRAESPYGIYPMQKQK